MNLCFLDSSAWLKRYLDEAGSDRIGELFGEPRTIVVSSLGVVEVLSVIARKQRAGEIKPGVATRAAAEVIRDATVLRVVDLTQEVLGTAMDLAAVYALRGADKVHLASAAVVRAARPDDIITFVTSDRDLAQAASLARFPVLDPEEV